MCSVYRCVSLILLGFPHLPCFGCSTSFPMISLSAMRSPDSFKKTKGCLWSPWSSRLPSYETNFMNCCNSQIHKLILHFFPTFLSQKAPLSWSHFPLRLATGGSAWPFIDEAKRIYSNLQCSKHTDRIRSERNHQVLTVSLIVKNQENPIFFANVVEDLHDRNICFGW